jgi:hypothetical protein
MNIMRLTSVPALAVALSGLTLTAAHASTEPLSVDSVAALAEASCQLDPLAPVAATDQNLVVVAEADVDVVPGEISAHVYRAQVTDSLGDTQECTFGVLHRDAQLAQVQHVGLATLARGDVDAGTAQSVETEIGLGNMGKGSPVDPTTEVSLGGILTPVADAVDDPTYAISLNRKSLEVVQVAVHRSQQDAAARQLKAELKAAAQLEKKQVKAAKGKHAAKAVAAAQKSYDKRVAAAQAAYQRATTPKTVTRPVSHPYTVTGSLVVSE